MRKRREEWSPVYLKTVIYKPCDQARQERELVKLLPSPRKGKSQKKKEEEERHHRKMGGENGLSLPLHLLSEKR